MPLLRPVGHLPQLLLSDLGLDFVRSGSNGSPAYGALLVALPNVGWANAAPTLSVLTDRECEAVLRRMDVERKAKAAHGGRGSRNRTTHHRLAWAVCGGDRPERVHLDVRGARGVHVRSGAALSLDSGRRGVRGDDAERSPPGGPSRTSAAHHEGGDEALRMVARRVESLPDRR
jgi:hypothetical protein